MPKKLCPFEPGYRYPVDDVGPYVDLHGKVTKVGEPLANEYPVTVATEFGDIEGWTRLGAPKVGYDATIRLYRAGGGWYPDNRIIGWSAP